MDTAEVAVSYWKEPTTVEASLNAVDGIVTVTEAADAAIPVKSARIARSFFIG